ncbi:MAG: hypothetical protein A2092_06950 [Rhodobacteraceae bacterium GWE1_64_9]|nr:MAG: hypothetical protein A2092_06950 [Rhodobacteraceae bacterium GWE1_64_9]
MAALIRPQAQMMEALLRQNIELLDFLRTRFERDRVMVAHLASATEAGDVMSLWAEFMQRSLADYGSETHKLAASVTDIAQQAVRSASDETAAIGKVLHPKA